MYFTYVGLLASEHTYLCFVELLQRLSSERTWLRLLTFFRVLNFLLCFHGVFGKGTWLGKSVPQRQKSATLQNHNQMMTSSNNWLVHWISTELGISPPHTHQKSQPAELRSGKFQESKWQQEANCFCNLHLGYLGRVGGRAGLEQQETLPFRISKHGGHHWGETYAASATSSESWRLCYYSPGGWPELSQLSLYF